MGKFFSIIVPIYNVEEYLKQCVESVLSQTFTDFELILVDDGSPDNCPKICDEYAEKDERVVVIHQENKGVSCARNAGMRVAGGKYIGFIDSDDALLYNGALEDIKKELDLKEYPDILLTEYKENDFEGGTGGEALLMQMVSSAIAGKRFNVTVWDKMYRSDFILGQNFFFEEGLIHEDLLWICLVIYNAKRCEFTTAEFYRHNIVEGSLTRSKSEESILKRSASKLQVAKIIIDYFKQKDNNKYCDIYEFFIGVYVSGIVESKDLKEKSSKKYFNDMLRKTADAIDIGLKTKRLDYKLLTILKSIFGIKIVKAIALLRK